MHLLSILLFYYILMKYILLSFYLFFLYNTTKEKEVYYMKQTKIYPLVLSSLFLALALVLPFVTGQLQQLGSMLLPMHLPIMLCGFICGSKYGLAVGLIAPLLRSFLFSMPMLYPNAIAMSVELATYGFTCGFLFEKSPWKCLYRVYISLLCSMFLGRVLWGIAMCFLVQGGTFTWQIFLTQSFFNAIPGIILQLVFIPSILLFLHKTHRMPHRHREENKVWIKQH